MKNGTKNETALAVQPQQRGELIRPVVTAGELIGHHREVTDIITQALEQGRDYGAIPGAGDKPVLLKPGAERLAIAFGCAIKYEVVEREIDHDKKLSWTKRRWDKQQRKYIETKGDSEGLYRYVVKCTLIHRQTGNVAGEGIGSASTLESKYIDRPRDLENTVLKMAQKRALVAAALNAFGLSDRFTQDVEDMEHFQQETTEAKKDGSAGHAPTLRALYDQTKAAGVPDELWKDTLKRLGITPDAASQTVDRLGQLADIVADWAAGGER